LAQVVSQDSLILHRRKWKDNGQCVVFAAGRFDLLHPGHIRLLEQARSHGDILIVGVQSDQGIRRGQAAATASKAGGASISEKAARPVTPAAERAEILAALAAVDYVVEFNEPSAEALISRLSPDIIVKGASPHPDPADSAEAQLVESSGAKILRILIEPGYSTSRLIERIHQTGA
jgi:rfaE bifunctional protein nucleotidyltransferase chain/domain